MYHIVKGKKSHIISRSNKFLELNSSVSLKQQKTGKKKKKTIFARLLWGVKGMLLRKDSVNPYYAEINGSPIFAGCTKCCVTRTQRFS